MLQGIKNELSSLVGLAKNFKFDQSAELLGNVLSFLDSHVSLLEVQKQTEIKNLFEESLSFMKESNKEKILAKLKNKGEEVFLKFLRNIADQLEKISGENIPVAKASVAAKNAPDSTSDKKDPLSMVMESITRLFAMTMGENGDTNFKQLARELPRAMIGILTGILSMLLPEAIMNKITKFTAPLLDLFDKNVALSAEKTEKASKKERSSDVADKVISNKSKTYTPNYHSGPRVEELPGNGTEVVLNNTNQPTNK